jgi:hypothetical protein
MTSGRALVLAYFEVEHLPILLEAIRAAAIPAGTPVYVGTYGPGRDVADAVKELPGGRYAPMFGIQPATSRRAYAGRSLPPDQEALLDARFAGAIPRASPNVPLPAEKPAEWGRELGARFRDSLRQARTSGVEIATWQFDEILREAAGFAAAADQRRYRAYTAGILEGLVNGRRQLGDAAERGIVWAAGSTLRRLPQVPVSQPGVSAFWQALNAASLLYVGQEYAVFRGNPEAAARTWGEGQRLMLREGVVRPQLGRKYVVGMTPGYHSRTDILGGNVDGLARAAANEWRDRFVRARANVAPLAGLAQFNFREGNAAPQVVHDAVRAAAVGTTFAVPSGHGIEV